MQQDEAKGISFSKDLWAHAGNAREQQSLEFQLTRKEKLNSSMEKAMQLSSWQKVPLPNSQCTIFCRSQ